MSVRKYLPDPNNKNEEYLKTIEKLKKIRYFNVRRSGTIICRECKIQSKTPVLHVEHVNKQHKHLLGFCPYCQKEVMSINSNRMTNRTKNHLKFCCFFHKVENSKFRKIFNTSCENEYRYEYGLEIVKTSILTLQHSVNSSQFLLNVLQYELRDDALTRQLGKQCFDYNHEKLLTRPDDNEKLIIKNLYAFHKEYTLSDSRSPLWWGFTYSDLCSIGLLVAKNKMEFDLSENIDCKLVRIMSLHWEKFNVFKYTIKYEEFNTNIEKFKSCIIQECFIITRYMHLFKDKTTNELMISMILIAKTKNCFYFCNELMDVTAKIYKIPNFDIFIDICYDLSNAYEFVPFLSSKLLKIYSLNYNNDVLAEGYDKTSCLFNDLNQDTKCKIGLNIFFSPLTESAKLYFYSQTKYGAVNIYNRLLQKNSLASLITDVIHDKRQYHISYAGLKLDSNTMMIGINLSDDEKFANEIDYRRMGHAFTFQFLSGKKLLFIDCDNIKMIIKKDPTEQSEDKEEVTGFPQCLLATNIQYKLTPEQETTFKVVQYHRDKLLLEINNIPQINSF